MNHYVSSVPSNDAHVFFYAFVGVAVVIALSLAYILLMTVVGAIIAKAGAAALGNELSWKRAFLGAFAAAGAIFVLRS